MPRGPKAEKRPADVIGNAVMVVQIVTGEDTTPCWMMAKTKPLRS